MIRPHLLLFLPFVSSALLAQTQPAPAPGNAASAQGMEPIMPKENLRAVTAADFGQSAPLYEDLARSPATKAELEFFIKYRTRFAGISDRGATTEDLLKDFNRRFPAVEKVAPALRVAVADALYRCGKPGIPDKGPVLDKLLAETPGESSIVRLYRLAVHAGWERWLRTNQGPGTSLAAFLTWHGRLFEAVRSLPEATRRQLSDETLYRILVPLLDRSAKGANKNMALANAEKAVAAWIEALPDGDRRAAHESLLGDYYTQLGWDKRGRAWAAATSDEQFIEFDEKLEIASARYHAAITKNRDFLRPYLGLLGIAMASPEIARGDENHWYSLCEKIAPGSVAGAAKYISSSQLRWGKSPSNLLNFSEKHLKEARYDTLMPYYATRALNTLIEDMPDGEAKDQLQQRRWEAVVEVYNRYVDDARSGAPRLVMPTGDVSGAYDKIEAFVSLLGSPNAAKYAARLHPQTGIPEQDKKIDAAFKQLVTAKENYAQGQGFSIETRYLKPSGTNAEVLRRYSDPEFMAQEIQAAESFLKKYTDPANKRSLDRALRNLRENQTYALGRAVTLGQRGKESFNAASAHGWTYGKGFVTARDLGVASSIHGTLHGYFDPPYQVTCKVRDVRIGPDAYFGVHIGRVRGGRDGRSFVLNQKTGDWLVLPGKTADLGKGKLAGGRLGALPEATTITLRILRHGYVFIVNDKPVHAARDNQFQPFLISLGIPPLTLTSGEMTFENPVVKKLKPEELSKEEADWMKDMES